MTAGRKALIQGIWFISAAWALAVLAVTAAVPAGAAQATAMRPTTPAAQTADSDAVPLDVVVLADESGSETSVNIAAETQAAGTIAQAMFSPRSLVAVVGFGGVNHVAPNQNPVNVACQPTIASGAANLSYLATCVTGLHRRTEAEGDDTDYAAALGQAMSYFNPDTTYGKQSPPGAVKVILMMTDGGVNVSRDTQQYGQDWMLGEEQAVNQQLALARQYGVQVWPLGFGSDITSQAAAYLNMVAQHGAQTGCDIRSASQPHAVMVNDSAQVLNAFSQIYAAAGCMGSSTAFTQVGGSNAGGTLQVVVPAIASDATISVDRAAPRVQVSFYQPDGHQWTDSSAISGQDSSIEVLHVADPEAGTWRVQLQGAQGLTSKVASATVFWQGEVRAVLTADPPSAGLDQPISVTLSVLGQDGPITDPSTVANLKVGVSVSGDGLAGPTSIPVTHPDGASGAGVYEGTFKGSRKAGTLTFSGTVAGYGLYATEVPASVQVGQNTPGFTASVQPPAVTSVQRGNGIQSLVAFVNQTGTARTVRLELSTNHAVATISPTSPVTARSGGSSSLPFTITLGKNSPAGAAWLEVKVVDTADPGVVYSDVTIYLTVTTPPGFLAKYLWVITGLLALIILALLAALWRHAALRSQVDVRGLVVMLRRDGEQTGTELRAPTRWSDTFRFVIRDEAQPTARLDHPHPGSLAYTVTRAGSDEISLMTPAGERFDVAVGGPGHTLKHNGLELAFREARHQPSASEPKKSRPALSAGQNATAEPSPAPTEQDPWL